MKFTKENLQAFNYVQEIEEQTYEKNDKEITTIIDGICKELTQWMCSNSGRNETVREKRYVWRNLHRVSRFHDQFIKKLGEVFIGCNFIIDPLKTYLIIDWS